MLRHPLPLALGVAAALLLACTGAPDPTGATIDVDDCAGNADIDDTVRVAFDFEDSAHEMVVCGAITFQFLAAVLDTAFTFAEGNSDLEDRFGFDAGTYLVEGAGVSMGLTLLYGATTPGGEAGAPLPANVFAADSWLVGANTSTSGDDLVVEFEEPGPLAPLLGQGASPSSPLTLTPTDLEDLFFTLTALQLEGVILVDDDRGDVAFTYEIDNPRAALGALASERTLEMDLVGATGERPGLSQQVSTTTWDLTYVDGVSSALQGSVTLEVTGGPFGFQAEYLYLLADPDPSITITCL